jgi:hypothetical protein
MLGTVTGLNVAAAGFVGFNLNDVGPEILVGPQRFDGDSIALGSLRMIWTGVVFFEDRVMNDSCRHQCQKPDR